MYARFIHRLLQSLKLFFFLCSPLLFLSCTSQTASPVSTDGATMESQTAAHLSPSQKMPQEQFASEITGITYPVDVYLPQGYEEAEAPFPVIYALDGQWAYDGYANILEERETAVILVSIHQGPEGRRDTDYLLPGALDYYQFITTELIPHIEEQYKIDPQNRTLVGVSYGGMFVSTVLFIEDVDSPYFRNYVSADAPFLYTHRTKTMDLERERYNKSPQMPVRLLLTSALLDASIGPFDEHVTTFQQRLEKRGFEGLEISRKAYEVDHYNVGDPTFADAVALFFE